MNKKRDVIITTVLATIYCVARFLQAADNDWQLNSSNINLIAALCLASWLKNTPFFQQGLDTPLKKSISIFSSIILLGLVVYSIYVSLHMEKSHVIPLIIGAIMWIVMAAVVGLEPKKDQEEK